MTKKRILYIFSILLCVFTSACNNDIFVDVSDLPDVTDVSISGNGAQWSTVLPRNGLTGIRINYSTDEQEYVRYYNKNRQETDADCPASELGSIVYENPKTFYSIGFSGDMIYINSNYNAALYTEFSIQLDYGSYTTKTVNVIITQGEKLRYLYSIPKGELKLDENFGVNTRVTSLSNKSSLTQKLEIMPFLESKCSDMVTPEESWAKKLILDMPMLAFNGEGWDYKVYKDIVLGDLRYFTPSQYFDKKITVDVPANTKAKVTYTLHYTQAVQNGTISLYNSVIDRTFEVPVKWTSVYATNFEYTLDYEPIY